MLWCGIVRTGIVIVLSLDAQEDLGQIAGFVANFCTTRNLARG